MDGEGMQEAPSRLLLMTSRNTRKLIPPLAFGQMCLHYPSLFYVPDL